MDFALTCIISASLYVTTIKICQLFLSEVIKKTVSNPLWDFIYYSLNKNIIESNRLKLLQRTEGEQSRTDLVHGFIKKPKVVVDPDFLYYSMIYSVSLLWSSSLSSVSSILGGFLTGGFITTSLSSPSSIKISISPLSSFIV